MKISVTYEKKDILRLVEQDLKAQGIKVKNGTTLEYKGALEVKLSVETEENDAPPLEAVRAPVTDDPPKSPVPKETPTVRVEDDADISSVLAASQRLVKNEEGKLRSLGPNESLDFPKD